MSPDSVMSPVVEPVCGFSWGYEVHQGKPTTVPISVDGLSGWADARELLARHCPRWTFLRP